MGNIINRRRAYGGKKGLLPSGYKQLEYIENTSNAYIDTGVKFYIDNSTEVIFDGWFTDTSTNLNQHICMIGTGYQKICWISNYQSQNYCFGRNNSFVDIPVPIATQGQISAKIYGNIFELQVGQYYRKQTDSTHIHDFDGLNLPLFARLGDNYQIVNNGKAIAKYAQIKVNDTLVRNFIPCINPNNVVGMYDTVNSVFYSSPNGTAFIAGPEV